MSVIQPIPVYVDSKSVTPKIDAVQYDTGRVVKMIIRDMTLASGYVGALHFKRSDQTYYYVTATLDLDNNAFQADITQALTQPGITECQLKVKSSSDSPMISTFSFNIAVQRAVNGIPVEQVGYTIDDLIAIAERAEDAAEDAEEAAASLTIDDELSLSSTNAAQNKVITEALNDKYEKPSGGIPKTDLDSAVAASLDKADGAIQSSTKGAANGVASLNSSGQVPATQLTAYAKNTSLATVESSSTASKAYKVGDYFVFNGDLCICTAAIASGGTITLNTNCKTVKLGDDVGELKSALEEELYDDAVWHEIGNITLTDNYYLNNSGAAVSANGWRLTSFIDISEAIQIKANLTSNYCAWYTNNSESAFIQMLQITSNTPVDVPATAKFVRFSAQNAYLNNSFVLKQLLESYSSKVDGEIQATNDRIDDVQDELDLVSGKKKEYAEEWDEHTGLYDDAPYTSSGLDKVLTDYIPITGFVSELPIIVRAFCYSHWGFGAYDKDKNLVYYVNGLNVADYGGVNTAVMQNITLPQNSTVTYVRITGDTARVSELTDLWVEGYTLQGIPELRQDIEDINDEITGIETDITEIRSEIIGNAFNSKVLVIGDSISVDSYGNYKKWVTDLEEEGFFDADKVTNSSVHATGFVATYNGTYPSFITRIQAIENKDTYDLVVVFGGINDFFQNIPFGSSGGDYQTYFKPAVEWFFDYLIQNFTQARICVLLPLRAETEGATPEGKTQQDYADYIKSVAKRYCFPVLDLMRDSGFCPYISTFKNMWTHLVGGTIPDGVHPNALYEKKYLAPMIKHFIEGLI